MNYIVLPLLAVPPSGFSIALLLNSLIGHALLVGLPIAWAARRNSVPRVGTYQNTLAGRFVFRPTGRSSQTRARRSRLCESATIQERHSCPRAIGFVRVALRASTL